MGRVKNCNGIFGMQAVVPCLETMIFYVDSVLVGKQSTFAGCKQGAVLGAVVAGQGLHTECSPRCRHHASRSVHFNLQINGERAQNPKAAWHTCAEFSVLLPPRHGECLLQSAFLKVILHGCTRTCWVRLRVIRAEQQSVFPHV